MRTAIDVGAATLKRSIIYILLPYQFQPSISVFSFIIGGVRRVPWKVQTFCWHDFLSLFLSHHLHHLSIISIIFARATSIFNIYTSTIASMTQRHIISSLSYIFSSVFITAKISMSFTITIIWITLKSTQLSIFLPEVF